MSVTTESPELEKLVYKYAYESVDSWDLGDLIEFAESKVIDEGLKRLKEDPQSLVDDMKDFWGVDSLDEINPDDFKC
jgi:hypothetical protein